MSTDTQPLHQKEELTLPKGMDPPPEKKRISGYLCLKTLLLIYSFFFLLIGILLVGIGYWIESAHHEYDSINDYVRSPAIIAIAVGAFIIVAAFCGLFGAVREHLCLLRTFFIFIILIFILQVTIGVLAFVYREETENIFQNQIESAVKKYTDNENIAKSIDKIQTELHCCGVWDPNGWDLNTNLTCNGTEGSCSVPDSCCRLHSTNCGLGIRKGNPKMSKLFAKGISTEGCYFKLHNYIGRHLDICGATALGLAIPQILGIFLVYLFGQKVEDRKWLFRYKDRAYE